jgi:hypothetical protein
LPYNLSIATRERYIEVLAASVVSGGPQCEIAERSLECTKNTTSMIQDLESAGSAISFCNRISSNMRLD